jgi:carbohydrate kinase (thermoresistant glucokinase family)
MSKNSPFIINHSPLFLIMGVSGCGKSTVAKALSESLKIPFIEADNFHPETNILKMKNGQPLDDTDREPWLQNLAKELLQNEKGGAVLACSALKEKYRTTLNSLIAKPLQIIFLEGSFDLIKNRMEQRAGHFMPAHLLQSQLDSLEKPKNAWIFNIQNDPKTIHLQILEKIKMTTENG